MKLSVIVPVYNMAGEGKLKHCLDSLLNQTISDYEVIAIDDASTDNSLEILREYEKEYAGKLVVLSHTVNKRQGGAKNTGLKVAKGEWIGFIDSDDWVTLDYYEKLLKRAEETGAEIVGCNYLITDNREGKGGTAISNHKVEQTGVLNEEKYRELILHPGSMVIKIYRRELFVNNAIVFPENIFYEDNAIAMLPFLYSKRFEYIDEAMYFYYQHSASTVHVISLERCRERMKSSYIYLDECKKRGFYERFKDEIEYKVFELGYRNTLFSYLQCEKKPKYKFVLEMLQFLEENIPNIEENPYFHKYVDAENKKFVKLHRKNGRYFLSYYKMLNMYRRLRYGKC